MTKKQQLIVNSKAYWKEVERKKQKLTNQKTNDRGASSFSL